MLHYPGTGRIGGAGLRLWRRNPEGRVRAWSLRVRQTDNQVTWRSPLGRYRNDLRGGLGTGTSRSCSPNDGGSSGGGEPTS